MTSDRDAPAIAAAATRIRLFGATSAAGRQLLPALLRDGHAVTASSRAPQAHAAALHWLQESLPDASPLAGDTTHLLSLGPLDLFVQWLQRQSRGALRQVIAVGSTSAHTKLHSAAEGEQALAQRLRAAESTLARECARLRARWTLLRPTLVYGGAGGLVARIGAIAARWHVYPRPLGRAGRALRQPLHAGDLARAAQAALDRADAYDRAFDLGGGEVLSLAALCRRAARAHARFALALPLPLGLLLRVAAALRLLPASAALSPLSRLRMQQDQVCDDAPARAALGHAPRPFAPGPT